MICLILFHVYIYPCSLYKQLLVNGNFVQAFHRVAQLFNCTLLSDTHQALYLTSDTHQRVKRTNKWSYAIIFICCKFQFNLKVINLQIYWSFHSKTNCLTIFFFTDCQLSDAHLGHSEGEACIRTSTDTDKLVSFLFPAYIIFQRNTFIQLRLNQWDNCIVAFGWCIHVSSADHDIILEDCWSLIQRSTIIKAFFISCTQQWINKHLWPFGPHLVEIKLGQILRPGCPQRFKHNYIHLQ